MYDAKSSLPRLIIPKQEAREKINAQIKRGCEIRDRNIKIDLPEIGIEMDKWHKYNIDLLKAIFDNEYMAKQYNQGKSSTTSFSPQEILKFKKIMDNHITSLESILERLELISEPEGKSNGSIMNTTSKPKIFVVHGRDPVRHELDALLLRWGLDPEMLEDQPNLGQILIEKFEKNSDTQCVIVLLTPDDEGRLKGTKELKPRPRQNVVFELGYFFGKSGRGKVICLHKGDIELPSDISGIVYIPFSDNLKDEVYRGLRKELKAMGFTIND